ALAHTRAAMQHPPGGDAVDDDGLGGGGIDVDGDGDEVVRVEDDAVGPAADLGERGDALAGGRAALDDPDQGVAGDERERRLVVVLAAPHLLLGERDAGGLDADDGLTRLGIRELAGAHLERLGLDDAWEDDLGDLVHDDLFHALELLTTA